MNSRPRQAPWLGWTLVAALSTFALHQAGGGLLAPPPLGAPGAWRGWLAEREPVVAAMAVLRLLALVAGWHFLASLVVGAVARYARMGTVVAVLDRLTAPAVRRLLTTTAGMTLASGVPAAVPFALLPHPAVAVASPTPPLATAAASQLTGGSTTSTTVGSGLEPGGQVPPTLVMRLLPPAGAASRPPPAVTPEADVTAGRTHTVRPGECFWSVAHDVLATAWGRAPTDAEVAPYWRSLIDANRTSLADPSNPDVIFPAQVFDLPPIPPG